MEFNLKLSKEIGKKYQKADFSLWKKYDHWTLQEAVLLLLGIDPGDNAFLIYNDIKDNGNEEIIKKLKTITSLMTRSIKAGNLKKVKIEPNFIDIIPLNDFNPSITPEDLIKWAHDKNINIPDELNDLNPDDTPYTINKGEVPKILDKRHPEFRIEIMIIEEVWYEFFENGRMIQGKPRVPQITAYIEKRYKELIKTRRLKKEMIKCISKVVNGGINKWARPELD